jgi:peptide/nickel transport system permease protein
MHGARISLSISILSTAAAVLIGAPVGWVTGYLGGWHDVIVMRLVDSLMAFPGVLLAMLLIATVGPGFVTIIVALGLTYSPLFVRTIRAATLVEREKEYVAAAIASGAHVLRILKCHILPNTRQILLVQGTLTLGLTVLSEATLSYLGLGPSPETPSWGRMVFEGQRILEISPHITLFPLSAIAGAVLGFNLLGSGLADVLDPRIRFGN